MEVPAGAVNLVLGGCFLGIGWFEPDNDPKARLSARWMGGGKHASVFVRLVPGHAYELRVTAHHLRSAEIASWLNLTVCGQPLQVERSLLAGHHRPDCGSVGRTCFTLRGPAADRYNL
jgi:hypothetical protein